MLGRCPALVCLLFSILFTSLAAAQSARDPVALAKEGAAALDERRFGDALEAFTAASAIAPREPSLCFGAGMAAFMLGRNDDAQAWFERALKLLQIEPEDRDIDLLGGFLDRHDEGRQPVLRLNDEFHARVRPPSSCLPFSIPHRSRDRDRVR